MDELGNSLTTTYALLALTLQCDYLDKNPSDNLKDFFGYG
jgi:hypothetical protein